ncbi:hypothetical protein Mgra_00000396, partial [Meloidogyne graminicola]
KKLPSYDRYCYDSSKEEVYTREKDAEIPVVRFKFDPDEIPFKLYSDSLSRKPIQHRLSFKPRISPFFRRPIRNNFNFKRPFRRHFIGEWRTWYSRGRGEWNNGYRDGYRKNRRTDNNNNNKRYKKTVAELDRELDEYMNANKHPRVHFKN